MIRLVTVAEKDNILLVFKEEMQNINLSIDLYKTPHFARTVAQTCLMVFGIVKAVSAAFGLVNGSASSFLAGGCLSAAFIIDYIFNREVFWGF